VTDLPTRPDIDAAADRIAGHVRATPVLAVADDIVAVLKLDLLQPTGSFKVRGATNLLSLVDVDEAGVVAASGGNFGLAVAWAARRLGHDAHVFVPDSSPDAKIALLRTLGATVHVVPGTYRDAYEASRTYLDERGGLSAHAYDQFEIVTGQGTCARELAAQAPDLDTVLVAVGGGGLIGGTAAWYRGEVAVVGVETEGCPTLRRALDAGRPVEIEVGGLAVSSLGASRIGAYGFAAAEWWVADSLLVSDDDVRTAQRWLWDRCRLVAEPGGATALAALTSGAYRPAPGERVGVIVCGANTDPAELA
jgi:threonine dehydratase